jgi:hypothetical protein
MSTCSDRCPVDVPGNDVPGNTARRPVLHLHRDDDPERGVDMDAHAHAHHGTAEHGADHGGGGTSWSMAAQATLHCLTGCAIGEVLGMVIGTATGLHNAGTIVLSIVLAFVFGYALTMRGVVRSGVGIAAAFKVALAADTVSIAVMEIVDNTVVVAIPGAMDAQLDQWLFWGALALSLAIAFVVTTPVNRWMISRGLGHAVVHGHH